jgi:predicted O-methyltransferase YrrM
VTHSWAGRDKRLAPEGPWALRIAASVGRRQLQTMKRAGLPVSLHEPLAFLLERQLLSGDYGPVDRVEALRAELARQQGSVAAFTEASVDGALPAVTWRADEARPLLRSLSDVAHISSVSAVWGTFLYLCAKAARARTILELGTAAGISGCYLASAPSCRRFITVEGDPGRARLAEGHLRRTVAHVEVVNASFEAAIERLLPGLHDGIDMAFIDGDKTRGSYLALLDRLSLRLNPGALVLFDDIQWHDVQQDWKRLCVRPGLSFVVNAGRFGICVWNGGAARPQAFTLYSLAGVDLYKVRRDVAAYLGGGTPRRN